MDKRKRDKNYPVKVTNEAFAGIVTAVAETVSRPGVPETTLIVNG